MNKYKFIKCSYECNSGWYQMLDELFGKIQSIVDELPKGEFEFEVVQVKEKFGTLRVYCNYYVEDIEDLIETYSKISGHVCEVCGEDGKLQEENGWYKTVCDSHHKEWIKKGSARSLQ
jgi:hypothetical protein